MDAKTAEFYDQFWPKSVPILDKTREYVAMTIVESRIGRALDAGCGHGICSIVLSERADEVLGVDVSSECISTARRQAQQFGRSNVSFQRKDLQHLDLPDAAFDLVWCWGVAMMAPDPMRVMHHLMRVTAPGGVIYLGLYLKTWLSPVHEFVRHFCRTFMNGPRRKKLVCDFFAILTMFHGYIVRKQVNLRTDNISIQAQVEDWYYPPYKSFYSIDEIIGLFQRNGFEASCTQDRVGRAKSATIFVIRATRNA